ncbi:hypothetical protein F5Y17DRAFT_317385 [Xylariaceae sp. FL0594]|nr:hypothetical protein F5Y17DRAFT_317385 [Xylariaceae sp. FL0594]
MASISETSVPFRFTLPTSLQTFDAFAKIPYDLRHQIWESLLFTPGIHFLKYGDTDDPSTSGARTGADTTSSDPSSSGALVERPGGEARQIKHPVYTAALSPRFSPSRGDTSHYMALRAITTQLRASCSEARHVVDKVFIHPRNLTLDNGQRILLGRSFDVVCIDYPGMIDGRHPGRWRERLDPSQLGKVRRLAVRYHHEWDTMEECNYCVEPHVPHETHPHPLQVYEFAALFKNLEAFYFLDSLTIRKPLLSADPGRQSKVSTCTGEWFSTAHSGRIYFEVDPTRCTTYTRVFDTLDWVRKHYIKYCRRRSLGPSDPEEVSFKILASEWDSSHPQYRVNESKSQATPPRKKLRRRHGHALARAPPPLRCPAPSLPLNNSGPVIECNTLPVVFGDDDKSNFEFRPDITLRKGFAHKPDTI